ncbi:hypothetical protein CRYUN_Cryun08bG0073400 [Craigia yunnanensis]
MLCCQEIATQRIIQAQSQREAASGPPYKDGTDLFSERPDPNALKGHLLKMTSEHRAEMASKRGKPTLLEEGNLGLVDNDIRQKNSELCGESKTNAASKNLPEYLKQKLRARGILKDVAAKDGLSRTDNNLETGAPQLIEIGKLPPGWVCING